MSGVCEFTVFVFGDFIKAMKILMICGVYDEENEREVLRYTKGYAEQSANIFQRKLISGIKKNGIEYKIISAPFIGAYPMRFKKSRFRGFAVNSLDYEYVPFNNVWGIRNFSRAAALKRAIKDYFNHESEEELLILVYCPHSPFLEAATYAKKLKPKSKICLVVPDLPQYMNLDEKGRGLYDFFKKYDIRHMERFIAEVDSFVLLTEPMKDVLKVGNRPYIVVEGIVEEDQFSAHFEMPNDGLKRIVYTGKMNEKFGIKNLVDAFMRIEDPDYRLILCGDGDARGYVEEMSKVDGRIEYKGMVTAVEAKKYIESADVLVNPRPNNEEYTKYSFPSKNIEYLMTGKPVVAYMLDGMPDIYESFLFSADEENIEKTIILALADSKERPFRLYADNFLRNGIVVSRILELAKGFAGNG